MTNANIPELLLTAWKHLYELQNLTDARRNIKQERDLMENSATHKVLVYNMIWIVSFLALVASTLGEFLMRINIITGYR